MSGKFQLPYWLYWCAGIFFAGFLVFLFSHICFGYDEYLWKTMYTRYGFFEFFGNIYDSISFRYSTHLYLYFTFNYSSPEYYRLFAFASQLVVFLILVGSLFYLFKTVWRGWLYCTLSNSYLLLSAIILSTALYFMTSQIVEIYTYTSSFYSYFMPVAFFCLGLSVTLSQQTGWWYWILLFIASFSVGGAAENVSASFLACMGSFLLYTLVQQKFNLQRLFSDKRIRKLAFFFLLTSGFALIAYTAPGARNRALLEANNLLLKSNPVFAPQKLSVFLSRFFHLSNMAGILFLCWFIHLGALIPKKRSELVKKILLLCFVSFILSVFIHLLITKIIFDSYGYLRIWFPVNFHLCLFVLSVLLYAGTKTRASVALKISSSAGLIALLFIITYSFRHYPKVCSFSTAYFARRSEVLENCTIEKTYMSKELPDPDILYFDKFVRFPEDSLSIYFCIFNEIPCKNVYIK